MDGIGNNRFASGSPFTPDKAPTAPPPPPEVKVRTLRSDLASMAKSGGGLPHFESVKVEGLSYDKNAKHDEPGTKGKGAAMGALMVIGMLVALGALGYLAYQYFGGALLPASPSSSTQGNSTPAPTPVPAAPTGTPAAPKGAPAQVQSFVHTSLFKKPADQTLMLTLSSGGAAASAADLQTFNQKLGGLLADGNKTATLTEVGAKSGDGTDLGIADILARANAEIMEPAFLAAHFNPDGTFFVYRDRNGNLWPGYVLAADSGENWLFLKSDIQKLESSPAISNIFLGAAGTPAPGGFADGMASGTAVRMLSFSGGEAPSNFTYGWYKTYLIVSASQGGFIQAAGRL